MSLYKKAAEKLEATYKDVTGRAALAMKQAVKDCLLTFADQDDEFAAAILDGGSFKACMDAVSKGVGQSISDLEAYSRSAAFYFPGCKVRFEMRIDLAGDEATDKAETFKPIVLNLEDFI